MKSSRNGRGSHGKSKFRGVGVENLEQRLLLADPDLDLLNAVAPNSARLGDTIQLSWTTKNRGAGDALLHWSDNVYMSEDAIFDPADRLLTSGTPNSCRVAAGAQYSLTSTATLRTMPTGDKFLLFVADAGSELNESDESNNVLALPITIQPALADLHVMNFTTPAAVHIGDQFDLSFTVVNEGSSTAAAAGWNDYVAVSDDAVFDAGDRIIDFNFSNGMIAPGASYTETSRIRMPNVGSGDKFLILFVDRFDGQAESDESDNVVVRPIQITLPPGGLADLVVTNVTAPAAAKAGETFNITFSVANQGTATSPEVATVALYISDDDQVGGGDRFLTSAFEFNRYPLAAGAGYSTTRGVTLPTTLTGGNKFLLAVVDANNVTVESSESNNVFAKPIQVTPLPPNADLVVQSATAPATAIVSDRIDVSRVVRNQGTDPAEADWFDTLYISDEPTLCGQFASVSLGSVADHTPLAPGAHYEAANTVQIPATAPGQRYFIFRADSSSQQPELDNDNNTFVLPVTLSAPNLTVTASTSPDSATLGQPIAISYTVTNNGSVPAPADWFDALYVSDDMIRDGSDTSVTTEFVSTQTPLAAGASYTINRTITLPSTAVGNRFLLFHSDAFNQQGETDETDNTRAVPITLSAPDLTVIDATGPASGVVGETISVSWTVKNIGSVPAVADWTDAVFVSDDMTHDFDDVRAATHSISVQTPLAPDGMYTITKNIVLPSTGAGAKFLLFRGDAFHNQGETDETNNVRALPITLQAPDLVVVSSTSPASAVLGDTVRMSWTVENQGSVAAPADWFDAVLISRDITADADDFFLTAETAGDHSPLAAGATYSLTIDVELHGTLIGDHYLIFVTDYYRNQGETDETNNVRAVPITLTAPDLIVTNAVAPASAVLGSSFEVSWTVQNQGTVPAFADWSDEIYVSDDATFDPIDDTFVDTFSVGDLTPLAAGDSYTLTRNIRIPSTAVGNRFLIFVADGFMSQGETNEQNNFIARPITLSAPDLAVTNVTAPPGAAVNKNIQISWTVANQGTVSTNESWSDYVYISNDTQLDFSDTFVSSVFQGSRAPLAPGASYTHNATVTIPNTSTGNRFLLIATDRFDDQPEWPETNNTRAVPITLSAADVDLVVSDSTSPAQAVLGSSINYSWTVTNQGTDVAQADWSDAVYLSDDSSFDTSDQLLDSQNIITQTPLAGGANYTILRTVTLPSTRPGNRFLLFRTDLADAQSETNNLNNTRAVPITLSAPDLVVSSAAAPAVAVIDRTVPVSWTVTNQGEHPAPTNWFDRVFLSDDMTLGASDTFVYSEFIDEQTPLAAGASYTVTQNVTIPNTSTGDRFILFVTDGLDHQGETDNTNNIRALPIRISPPEADLVVQSITAPDSVILGGTVEISWTVANQGDLEAAANWSDEVYLSNDAVLGAGDLSIATRFIDDETPLQAGSQYSITRSVLIPATALGDRFLLVKTDVADAQRETNESNNVRAVPITLHAPDLVVSDASAPALGVTGDTIDVSFDVFNSGTVAAPADWIDAVYVSADDSLDDGDLFLGSASASDRSPLAAGDGYTVPLSLMLRGAPGEKFLLFKTDYLNNQPETNDGNNVRAVAITVVAPDLMVTNATVPANAASGEQIRGGYTVENGGSVRAAADWFDAVYFSANAQLDAGDVLAYSESAAAQTPLAPGQSYSLSPVITVPSLANGNWFAIFVADHANHQGETNETNNYFAVPITIGNPDLAVTEASGPASASAGDPIPVAWTVSNLATPPASATWFDAIYISDDDAFDVNDRLVSRVSAASASPLAGDASYTQSGVFPLPAGLAGNKFLLIVTDELGHQAETNEANNVLALPITLTSVDLVVESVTAPSSARFGDAIMVEYTVRNAGSGPALQGWRDHIVLSTNGVLDSSDVVLHSESASDIMPLAGGASYTRRLSVTLPITTLGDGNYFLLVVSDAELPGQVESNENNNLHATTNIALELPPLPNLEVTRVAAPETGFTDQLFVLSWTVTNTGDAPADGTWSDDVFLSTDSVLDRLDTHLGRFPVTGSLAPGESLQRAHQIRFPHAPGSYHIFVVTDAQSELAEGPGDLDNVGTPAAIDVDQAPLPDLIVTSITPPPNGVFAGTTTQVTFVVQNVGNAPTAAPVWSDYVFINQDPNITFDGRNDRFILIDTGQPVYPFANASYLEPGESYSQTVEFPLPHDAVGPWYAYVVADGLGNRRLPAVSEQSDANNLLRSTPFEIDVGPVPDLRITAAQAPRQAFSGQPINLSWTVSNAGTKRTPGDRWIDQIFMSADDTLDTGDRLLAEIKHFGALQPTQEYAVNTVVNLPIGVSGEFFFLLAVDVANAVFEHAGESNNVGSDSPATLVNLTPPPDLETDMVVAPATALAGHEITLSYRVTNAGAGRTPNAGWTEAFFLSRDTEFDPLLDTHIGEHVHFGILDAGEEHSETVTVTLPNGLEGDYFVLVQSDSKREVFENGETANNVGVSAEPISIASRPADLVVSAALAPAAADSGSAIVVQWTVSNQGIGDTAVRSWVDRVVLSTDAVLGNGDDRPLAQFVRTGLLGPGESYTRSELVTIPFLVAGPHRLFIVTDAVVGPGQVLPETGPGGAVYEAANELNNSSAPLAILLTRNTPDLQVTDIQLDGGTYASGEPITVHWTTRNAGAGRTHVHHWHDDVFLSRDDTYDASDVWLGSLFHTGVLEAGEQYEAELSLRIPVDLASGGSHFVIVRTDRPTGRPFDFTVNRVFEGAEEHNNSRTSAPIDVELGAVSDLVPESITAPATAVAGRNFSLSYQVRNQGQADALRRHDSYYLSADQVFDRFSDRYLSSVPQPPLAAGLDQNVNVELAIPPGVAGSFYVFVVVDSTESNFERAGESNNVAYDRGVMQVALAAPVDLVIGEITVPAGGLAGEPVTVTYTVHNQSTAAAIGSWHDSLYISSDQQLDSSDAFLGRVHHIGDVAAGASYSESLHASLPALPPGNYFVVVRTDVRNRIIETNERNNISASLDDFRISVAQLTLGVAANGTLRDRHSAFYQVDVGRGETLVFRFDSASTAASNELYVRYGSLPSRIQHDFRAAEPFQPDQEIVVPFTRAGTYYVLAFGAAVPGPATYSIVADVVPFSVRSVAPGRAGNSGPVTLEIRGARFDHGTQFELLDSAGGAIPAAALFAADSSLVYATFNISGHAPGSYRVRAIQANGTEATLENGLEVVSGIGANVEASVTGPDFLLQFRPATLSANYGNNGDGDAVAPLVLLTSPSGAAAGLTPGTTSDGGTQFLAISFDGPAGVLRPGSAFNIPIHIASATPPRTIVDATIVTAESTDPLDWAALARDLKPVDLPEAVWNETIPKLRERIGETWGGYVRALAEVATLLSGRGRRVYDPTELFTNLYHQEAGFHDSVFSGRVVWDDTGEPVAGAHLFARYIDPNAPARFDPNNPTTLVPYGPNEQPFIKSGFSNESGDFELSGLRFGSYEIFFTGLDTMEPVQVSVSRQSDARGVELRVVAKPDPEPPTPVPDRSVPATDLEPSLAVDTTGRTHIVWQRSGSLWHATAAPDGSWTHAAPIPFAVGTKNSVRIIPNLADGVDGVLVTWISGTGNQAEIRYSVGNLSADGTAYEWTMPTNLTNNSVNDDAYDVVVLPSGAPFYVWNKIDATIQDDSDLYAEVAALPREATIVVTIEEVPEDPANPDAIARDTGEMRLRLGVRLEAYVHPETPIFGGKWEFTLRGVAKGRVTCNEATANAQGDIILKHRGDVIGGGDHEWTGQLGVQGRLVRESNNDQGSTGECQAPDLGDYKPHDASVIFTIGANAQYDIIDILTKIKPAGPVLAAVNVAANFLKRIGISAGIRLELRTNFQGRWNPSDEGWLRPPDEFIWTTTGSIGGFARWKVEFPWIGQESELTARVQWAGQLFEFKDGRLDISPHVSDICAFGRYQLNGKKEKDDPVKGPPLKFLFSRPRDPVAFQKKGFYSDFRKCWPLNAGARNDPMSGLSPIFDGMDEIRFSVGELPAGTMNTYLDSDGSDQALLFPDTIDQGTPSMVMTPDGTAYVAYTDLHGLNLLRYDSSTATWHVVGTMPGTPAIGNSGVRLAVDGAGHLLAVWSSPSYDATSLTEASTSEEIWSTIKVGGDLIWATYDPVTDEWTSTGHVHDMVGPESQLRVTNDASGNIVAAWLHMVPDDPDPSIYAAIWDSATATWRTPQRIHTGPIIGSISVATLDAKPVVMWSEIFNITTDSPLDYDIRYATLDGGVWSAPMVFSYDSMGRDAARTAPRNGGDDNWLDYDFEPPEDCNKDNEECECKKNKDKNKPKKPPKPPTNPDNGYDGETGGPKDPNEIIGPVSFGDRHYVAAALPMHYTVLFENAPEATAPAQEVVITQQLDTDLDFRTFRLLEFGWGNRRFQVPPNSAFHQERIDLRDELSYFVDVFATIDVQSGLVTFTLTTIDPATGEKPLDGRVGFLPPDTTDGVGDGFFSYRVRPKASARTGDVIDALATIVFDTEPPLDTPPIFHTLDARAPSSQVLSVELPPGDQGEAVAGASSRRLLVRWAGDDDGSAVRDFDLYVSENGGPFVPWLEDTMLTEAIYLGDPRHNYAFYSIARDNAGNIESAPATADAHTGGIRGRVFNDPNGNGQLDPGESPIAGHTVYLDLDGSGAVSSADLVTETDADGHYAFPGLPPGSYSVHSLVPPGSTQTVPAPPGSHAVDLAAGAIHTGNNFAFDAQGPAFVNVQWIGGAKGITNIVLTASEALDPAQATRLANYQLFAPGKDKRIGTRDDSRVKMRSATYDPLTFAVSLVPSKPLKLGQAVRIVAGGDGAVTDAAGNPFDADRDGVVGDNFTVIAAQGTRLTYADSDGDTVNLSLANGGVMELSFAPNGEGLVLRLSGTTASSVLSGTVKRPKRGGSPANGSTTLQAVTGLGAGRNDLADPPFRIPAGAVSAVLVDSLLEASQSPISDRWLGQADSDADSELDRFDSVVERGWLSLSDRHKDQNR